MWVYLYTDASKGIQLSPCVPGDMQQFCLSRLASEHLLFAPEPVLDDQPSGSVRKTELLSRTLQEDCRLNEQS